MAITEQEFAQAKRRMAAIRSAAHAISAQYDRCTSRVIVQLNTGLELAFPPELAEGLANADAAALSEIDISPTGLGLHWPKLDADLYLPAILQGMFGSKHWMAQHLGGASAHARNIAKTKAARQNGRQGEEPYKHQVAGEGNPKS